MSGGDAACNQMSRPQGLGNVGVYRQAPENMLGLLYGQPGTLHVDGSHMLDSPGFLNQRPFLLATAHLAEGGFDGGKIGLAPRDHQHRQAQVLRKCSDVHHVEPAQGNALQQYQSQAGVELGVLDELGQDAGTVPPVAPNLTAQHAFQPQPVVHHPHHPHVAPVMPLEGKVVKADHVGESAGFHRGAYRVF